MKNQFIIIKYILNYLKYLLITNINYKIIKKNKMSKILTTISNCYSIFFSIALIYVFS